MLLGYENLLKDQKIVFVVSLWIIKETKNNQQDWLEKFYPSNSLFSFSVFMKQIPLAIELPSYGELGEKGEFMEKEGGF